MMPRRQPARESPAALRTPRASAPDRPVPVATRDRPARRSRTRAGRATVFDTARELLSTDFYLRKWGRLGMRNRSEEVDDFGFDPVYEQKVRPFFDFLYERVLPRRVRGARRHSRPRGAASSSRTTRGRSRTTG